MPVLYHKMVDEATRLAVWNIDEPELFFATDVSLHSAITHPQKRLQHLAGRFLLSYLFPDFPRCEIMVADTKKPYLPAEQYHFSISHCDSYAAAIVSSDRRVGIDAEVLTQKVAKVKHKFLHPYELDFVHAKPDHEQLRYLSIAWSAKEAMYKWYGLGEVDFREMLRIAPFTIADTGVIAARFSKNDLQQDLTLHYCLIGQLTLVWVAS